MATMEQWHAVPVHVAAKAGGIRKVLQHLSTLRRWKVSVQIDGPRNGKMLVGVAGYRRKGGGYSAMVEKASR